MLVVMRVVLPSKGDVGVVDREKAMVGNGDAMGIASEIVQDVFWPTKRRFGIDDQVLSEQSAQEGGKRFLVASGKHSPWKASRWLRKAQRNPARNLPRKTRLSTLTGKKKWDRDEIQQV